jgi:phage portal protein BeeE
MAAASRSGIRSSDLLNRPDPNGAGDGFFETLYGHLVLSGNGWINPVSAGGRMAGLQLLRPDRMRVIEGRTAGRWPMSISLGEGGSALPPTPKRGRACCT